MPVYNIKREQLIELMPKEGITAELGVGRGNFSERICKLTKPKKHYCVDVFAVLDKTIQGKYFASQLEWDNRYAAVQDKLSRYNVEFLRTLTYNIRNHVKPGTLDWVYVDGDHSYEGCQKDLQAVNDCVKQDGFILGHDYTDSKYSAWGVVNAVNEFVEENNYYLTVVTQERFPSYLITKTAEKNEEILARVKGLC
jgi:hypothetical protein